jgi:putative Mg2+ transporter-C (MgtC) family protein
MSSVLAANGFIGLNLLGALLLGMLVGYERTYHGRAAGMRTYGLVCMASTALTVFVGYVPLWYGGSGAQTAGDPLGGPRRRHRHRLPLRRRGGSARASRP